MIYIGIDPGLKGAMVALNAHGQIVDCACADKEFGNNPAYAAGKRMQPSMVRKFFEKHPPLEEGMGMIAIEAQSGRPTQGRGSLMSIARQEGCLEGLCIGLSRPYTIVRPQTWRKSMDARGNGENPKDVSLRVAQQLYPDFEFVLPGRRKPHEGLADALLIARYAWKEHR